MKVWKKYMMFGLMLCLGITYTSCNDSLVNPNDQEEPDKPISENQGYFSFSLTTDNDFVSSKAETEDGLAAEQKVNKVYLCFYQAGVADNLAKLIARVELNASTDGTNAFSGTDVLTNIGGNTFTPTKNSFITKPMLITKDDYQLVALVNPTAVILNKVKPIYTTTDTEKATPLTDTPSVLSELLEVVSDTKTEDYTNSTTGFFMSNANWVRNISASNLANTPLEAAQYATPVLLDRIVAKVRVNEKSGGATAPDECEVSNVTWTLETTNKKTYLLRNLGLLAPAFNQETPLNSPLQDRYNQYAVDPNFDGHTAGGYDWDTNYNILNKTGHTGNYSSATFTPWNDKDNTSKSNYLYALENTTDLTDIKAVTDLKKQYITSVIIKANINITTTPINGGNYYSCKLGSEVKVFTHAQAKRWRQNASSVPTEMNGIRDVLIAAEGITGSPFNFSDSGSEPTEFVFTTLEAAKGLTFHHNGLNIYPPIYIKHFGMTAGSEPQYGYYGVVRNNVYELTVNEFLGIGTPASDMQYISADITVNPWYIRDNQEEDL